MLLQFSVLLLSGLTLLDNVFDTLLLLALAFHPLVLFAQFWQHIRLDSFEYTWQCGILSAEQPSQTICWVLEEDSAFKSRVPADAQVPPYRRHLISNSSLARSKAIDHLAYICVSLYAMTACTVEMHLHLQARHTSRKCIFQSNLSLRQRRQPAEDLPA